MVGVIFLVIAAILVGVGVFTGGAAWVPAYGVAAAGVLFIIGGTPYGAHDVMAAGGDCESERKTNPTKNESEIWKSKENVKGKSNRKTLKKKVRKSESLSDY